MRAITKAAIIGAGCLAAYWFLVRRPQTRPGAANIKTRKVTGNFSLIDEKNIERFNSLPLKAHDFLAGIPLHSLDYVELPGGREPMTIADIYRVAGLSGVGEVELGAATKALFWLRGQIGKIMRWDDAPKLVESFSYLPRLSRQEREKSLLPPGKTEGIARVLYCFENELLLEIINKTVHCFWLAASSKTPGGYALYNAVYVKSLNWRTPVYMALISPVLKLVIYPARAKSIRRNWEREFPDDKGGKR
jgi:hypothetical protein